MLGATLVPLNAWWKAEELEFGLTDSEAKVLIGDARRDRARARPAAGDARARARVRDRGCCGGDASRSSSPSCSRPTTRGCRRRRSTRTTCSRSLHVGHDRATEGRDAHAPPDDREPAEHHRAGRRGRDARRRRRPKRTPACSRASLLVVPLFHVTGCLSTMTRELRDRRQARAHAGRPLRSRRSRCRSSSGSKSRRSAACRP